MEKKSYEVTRGTFVADGGEQFSITFTRRDVADLLRRLELFRKYRTLVPNLHEMVFDDGLGGYFCRQDPAKAPRERLQVRPAGEMLICAFDAADMSELSSWYVREGGRLRHDPDAESYLAIQWRSPHPPGGAALCSEPLWEDELREILAALSSSST